MGKFQSLIPLVVNVLMCLRTSNLNQGVLKKQFLVDEFDIRKKGKSFTLLKAQYSIDFPGDGTFSVRLAILWLVGSKQESLMTFSP